MKKIWIVFYDRNGNELLRMTKRGTFPGEIEATLELLAYESEVAENEIEWAEVMG